METAILYTTPTCAPCEAIKELLEAYGLGWTEKDVSQDAGALQEMVDKSRQTSVPVLELDGEVIVGFKKKEIVRAIHQAHSDRLG